MVDVLSLPVASSVEEAQALLSLTKPAVGQVRKAPMIRRQANPCSLFRFTLVIIFFVLCQYIW